MRPHDRSQRRREDHGHEEHGRPLSRRARSRDIAGRRRDRRRAPPPDIAPRRSAGSRGEKLQEHTYRHALGGAPSRRPMTGAATSGLDTMTWANAVASEPDRSAPECDRQRAHRRCRSGGRSSSRATRRESGRSRALTVDPFRRRAPPAHALRRAAGTRTEAHARRPGRIVDPANVHLLAPQRAPLGRRERRRRRASTR